LPAKPAQPVMNAFFKEDMARKYNEGER